MECLINEWKGVHLPVIVIYSMFSSSSYDPQGQDTSCLLSWLQDPPILLFIWYCGLFACSMKLTTDLTPSAKIKMLSLCSCRSVLFCHFEKLVLASEKGGGMECFKIMKMKWFTLFVFVHSGAEPLNTSAWIIFDVWMQLSVAYRNMVRNYLYIVNICKKVHRRYS
jgi:hypothetical protein